MDSPVTLTELQVKAGQIVRRAEKNGSVSVARHGRTVAFLVSRERMEAMLETMEIMSDRNAMKAIRDYESGKLALSRKYSEAISTQRRKDAKPAGATNPKLNPLFLITEQGPSERVATKSSATSVTTRRPERGPAVCRHRSNAFRKFRQGFVPKGPSENSPAFQRRVHCAKGISPEGTAE